MEVVITPATLSGVSPSDELQHTNFMSSRPASLPTPDCGLVDLHLQSDSQPVEVRGKQRNNPQVIRRVAPLPEVLSAPSALAKVGEGGGEIAVDVSPPLGNLVAGSHRYAAMAPERGTSTKEPNLRVIRDPTPQHK